VITDLVIFVKDSGFAFLYRTWHLGSRHVKEKFV
jgi:hypothetical protein